MMKTGVALFIVLAVMAIGSLAVLANDLKSSVGASGIRCGLNRYSALVAPCEINGDPDAALFVSLGHLSPEERLDVIIRIINETEAKRGGQPSRGRI